MFRVRLSVESLEARETPSSVTGRITEIAVDPVVSGGSSGPGVYRSINSGQTWTLAPDGGTAASAKPLPVLLVIADQY
jgi:hypothetical protein